MRERPARQQGLVLELGLARIARRLFLLPFEASGFGVYGFGFKGLGLRFQSLGFGA